MQHVPWWLRLIVTVLFVSSSTAFMQNEANVLEQYEYVGASHYAFGNALGRRFQQKIQERVQLHVQLQQRVLPYYTTTTHGKALYKTYLKTHNQTFPQYVQELEGIAAGSSVSFDTIFLLNIVEEYGNSIPASYVPHLSARPTLKCSDVVLVSPTLRVVAHNEDSGASDVNRTVVVTAQIADAPKFVAYTYLGDLPSGAFGFNDRGIAFTLNFVQPSDIEIGGLGRGFISRDLLAAQDADDAMQRITRLGQAAGHNYQLMDVSGQRIWNLEVASFNRWAIQAFESQPQVVTTYFHANQYQLLNIPQPPYASSIHRLQRYAQLTPPQTIEQALWVLGDQKDRQYPIYHDALSHERGELSGWTLITIYFDLLQRKAYSMHGNPRHHDITHVWDLDQLTVMDYDRSSYSALG